MDAPTSFPFRHTLPPLDIPYHILGIPCPPPPTPMVVITVDCWQGGGTHPTGMLSCFLISSI